MSWKTETNKAVFYVYQYIDENGLPYYIGKGKDSRIHKKHVHTLTPSKEKRIKIAQNLTNAEAKILEGNLIQKYGRKVDGGILDNIKINQWACHYGWRHSKETKMKISKTMLGIKKSEATKQKMKQPKSKEHIEKIRIANIGRKDDGRYIKIGSTMSKKRWYNDGQTTKMFEPGKEPAEFTLGRKVGIQNDMA